MRKLSLYPIPIPNKSHVILYMFHDENDITSISLETQEQICKEYIASHDWILEMECSDLCSYKISFMDRKGVKDIMRYLNKNKPKNCWLVLYSPRIFGSEVRSAVNFIGELEKKDVNIFIVEDKFSAELGSGLFALQMGIISKSFFNKLLNEVYLIFATNTSNVQLQTYKGSCVDEDQLRKVLSSCVNDNYVQIRCLSNLKNCWGYTVNSVISSEIDTCVKLFLEHVN